MNDEILNRTVGRYRQLAQLNSEMEGAVHAGDFERVTLLCRLMDDLQAAVQADDGAVLNLLRQRGDGHDGRILELLALMQDIQERSQRLLPHLNAIMAVQRSELQKLRQGGVLLQGYKQPVVRAGGRISSTN